MDHAPFPQPPPSPTTDEPHLDRLWELLQEARRTPGAHGGLDRAWAEDYQEVE